MKLTKSIIATTLVVLVAAFSFIGCEKESPVSLDGVRTPVGGQTLAKVSVNGNDAQIVDLIADRTVNVGDVSFDDVDLDDDGTADALEVTFTTTGGWELVETHLWIGSSLSAAPTTKKGNPIPGHFPYHSGSVTGTTYSIVIPFAAFGYECGDLAPLYVAAHAALRKPDGAGSYTTASGWSSGDRFVSKGNWATYSTIVIDCSTTPPSTPHPAFSYAPDALCLSGYGMAGWTNFIVDEGTYSHVLYADPTGCDPTAPTALTAVGTVTLVYDGVSTATVTFEMFSPYTLKLAAIYYGDSEAPPSSDPNTYTLVHTLTSSTSDTFTITNFPQFTFFVAQASVEGF